MRNRLMLGLALCALVTLIAIQPVDRVSADPPLPGYDGATPTLGTVLWNVRGGDPAGEEPTGGDRGGELFIQAENGAVIHDDSRSRPASVLGTNIFAGALADNKVTFAEIEALDEWDSVHQRVVLDEGQGIELPSGTTLDLRDAPEDVYHVLFDIQDDVVLLHGTIRTDRSGYEPVGLGFYSQCPTSVSEVSLVFTGHMNLNGRPGWSSLGVNIETIGTIIALGTIDAKGGKGDYEISDGVGGMGGMLAFISENGDVILGAGSVEAGGGKGATGGNFVVTAKSTGTSVFDWGLSANGGSVGSDAPGDGGRFSASFTEFAEFNIRVVANSGSSPDDLGPGILAGIVTLECPGEVSGHLRVTLDGGAPGSSGGTVWVDIAHGAQVTLSGSANGSDGLENGGEGGTITLSANTLQGVLIDLKCHGGGGEIAPSAGGQLRIRASTLDGSDLDVDGLEVHFDARGGETDIGGTRGGEVHIGDGTSFSGTGLDLDINVPGGKGAEGGGQGGYIFITSTRVHGLIDGVMNLEARGGSGGGDIRIEFLSGGGTISGTVIANASGVAGTESVGGASGGSVRIRPNATASDFGSFIGSLDVNVSGRADVSEQGSSLVGGSGGSCTLSCGTGGEFTCSLLNIDARGGNSDNNSGGTGGTIAGTFNGDFVAESGALRVSGGKGGLIPDSGGGGGWAGTITLATDEHLIDLNSTIHAFGGNGEGDEDLGNSGGRGGTVRFLLNYDNDGVSGSLVLRANANLRGGNSSESYGEQGGTFEVLDGTASSGGNVDLLAEVNANGGKTPHEGNSGGNGGKVIVDVAGQVTVHAKLLANGGSGGSGGHAIGPINLGRNRAAGVTLKSTAVVRANGGVGHFLMDVGRGGDILLDPAGSGPSNPNLVEEAGSIVTATGDPAGTITRD